MPVRVRSRLQYTGVSYNGIITLRFDRSNIGSIPITPTTRNKISQFPYDIEIYYKEEMKPFIEYVKNKYGKDFIKLYEENKMVL